MLEADYTLFATAQNLSSANIPFQVTPGTLKLSLTLSRWNFNSTSTGLNILLNVNIQPAVTSITTLTTGNITTYTLFSSNILITRITLLHHGIADNRTIEPVGFSLNATTSTPYNSSYVLVIRLPRFNSSFFYDPDFSVTLEGESGDGGSSGPGLLPLLALIALVIPIAMVLVLCVVIVILAIKRRRWMNNFPANDAVAI